MFVFVGVAQGFLISTVEPSRFTTMKLSENYYFVSFTQLGSRSPSSLYLLISTLRRIQVADFSQYIGGWSLKCVPTKENELKVFKLGYFSKQQETGSGRIKGNTSFIGTLQH